MRPIRIARQIDQLIVTCALRTRSKLKLPGWMRLWPKTRLAAREPARAREQFVQGKTAWPYGRRPQIQTLNALFPDRAVKIKYRHCA